jgi:hypothetical protein
MNNKMTQKPLLDTLFIKRFCLPSNIDISNDNYNISACLCGNFNHAACVLKGKAI